MGNSASTPLVNFSINLDVFCLTFAGKDRVRLIIAPDEIIRLTGDIISSSWIIQKTTRSLGLVEFKLKGYPMETMGSTETYNFKYLVSKIIKNYYELGWAIEATPCLNQSSTSQIIFKKNKPIDTQIACICLDGNDLVAVLGPDNMVYSIRETLNSFWHKGILNEFNLGTDVCQWFQFKLIGFPWVSSNNEDFLNGANLVCEIFKSLEKAGWPYLASIGFSKKSTLFFKFSPENVNQNIEMFPLVLDRVNRINVLNSPLKIIDLIRESIKNSWLNGIENESGVANVYEFMLSNNPWLCVGPNSVGSKRIVNKLIECLKLNYYELYTTSDLCSNNKKYSTLFFKKSQNSNIELCKTLMLSFNELNKLRITDDLNAFSDIIKDACQIGWQRGIREELNFYGSCQFELVGYPFKKDPFSKDCVEFIIFMLILFDNLDRYSNLKFVSSIDLYDSLDSMSNGNALVFQTS